MPQLTETERPLHLPAVTIAEHANATSHLLLWQVRGASDFVIEGQDSQLTAGQALWIPARVRHGFTTHVNAVLLPMSFDAAATATTLREPTLVSVDRDLRTLFLAFVQTTYSIIRPQANLARQILTVIEDRPPPATNLPDPRSAAARRVAEALRLDPGDERSIDELAASVHVSARTIERSFAAETGMTLRRWRIENRMETAGLLLRAPAPLVDSVAQRVGYTHTSAFRRVFKGHFGMTPSEYVARFSTED